MPTFPVLPGSIPRLDKPAVVLGPAITITANRKLKKSENNAVVIFNSTTTLTATLPAPFKGGIYTFIVKVAATSGLGHGINTSGTTEKTYARGFTPAAGKGAVNTQVTGVMGDSFEVCSDGTDWFGYPLAGTWARQA